jgi:hypothetical protein
MKGVGVTEEKYLDERVDPINSKNIKLSEFLKLPKSEAIMYRFPSSSSCHADSSSLAEEIYQKLWGTKGYGETMNSYWNTFKLHYMLNTRKYISRNQPPSQSDKEKFEKNHPFLMKFREAYHTLGNFIIVPVGFNSGRSLHTGDYWLLAQNSLEIL